MTRAGKSLILVRHAEAEHHIQEITGGWTDSSLTEKGLFQARLLAGRLTRELGDTPFRLGSSDLQRASQTAVILGERLGLAPVLYPPLRDLNNGIAAGMTQAEAGLHAIEPSEPLLDWQPYPDAETWRQFYERVAGFIERSHALQEQATILVTHAAAIHVILSWWLQLDLESRTFFGIAPASLTVLKLNRWGEHTVERLNDTSHLYAAGLPDSIQI